MFSRPTYVSTVCIRTANFTNIHKIMAEKALEIEMGRTLSISQAIFAAGSRQPLLSIGIWSSFITTFPCARSTPHMTKPFDDSTSLPFNASAFELTSAWSSIVLKRKFT